MRRIINYHVEAAILEGHSLVVDDHCGTMPLIDIQADDLATNPFPGSMNAFPESPRVHSGIKDKSGRLLWVKTKHSFQQIRIGSFPDGRKWLISWGHTLSRFPNVPVLPVSLKTRQSGGGQMGFFFPA